MRVTVRLFAILRDACGTGEFDLELPENATVDHAARAIADFRPELGKYLPRVAFALNQAYANRSERLKDGDELALIPPVSGG